MDLLNIIIEDEEASIEAKRSAYLIIFIKQLGWSSLTDKSVIKPTSEKLCRFLQRNSKTLYDIFGIQFSSIKSDDVVDVVNPLLINIWHIQIIGSLSSASLELLINKK